MILWLIAAYVVLSVTGMMLVYSVLRAWHIRLDRRPVERRGFEVVSKEPVEASEDPKA